MITMKTINASDLAQRDAFFESLDKRTGETNQRVTETVSEIIRTVKTGGDEASCGQWSESNARLCRSLQHRSTGPISHRHQPADQQVGRHPGT